MSIAEAFTIIMWILGAFVGLIFYTPMAFGVAYVIGYSEITQGIRDAWHTAYIEHRRQKQVIITAGDDDKKKAPFLLKLIECPACFGWWLGLYFGAAVTWILDCPLWLSTIVAFLLAFYTAGSNFILGRWTRLID